MCFSVFFRGGGCDVNLKNLVNIHLGVVTTRKFCLRYESILDPPMSITFQYQPMPNAAAISSLQNVSFEQIVTAKVLELSAVKVLHTAHGSFKKQEDILVDETSSIKIILWENEVEKLEKGETYILRNLCLKECHGEKYVNTPKTGKFKFEAGKELNNLAEADNLPLKTTCTISADIVVSPASQNPSHVWEVHGKVVAEDDFLGICSTCKVKQKISCC